MVWHGLGKKQLNLKEMTAPINGNIPSVPEEVEEEDEIMAKLSRLE